MTSIESQQKMVLSSDQPNDKVTYIASGSFSLPGSTTGFEVTIPHHQPYTPLCGGNWSLLSDFSVQYEYSSGTFPSGNLGFIYNKTINVFADATNVYLSCDNIGSTATVYYRVFGFMPPASLASVDPVSSLGSDFVINSDFNNSKVILNSSINLPAGGGSFSLVGVDHNIGVIPQAMGWVTYDTFVNGGVVSAIHPVGSSNGASEGITLVVNEVEIVWVIPAFVGAHVAYYRVYADE